MQTTVYKHLDSNDSLSACVDLAPFYMLENGSNVCICETKNNQDLTDQTNTQSLSFFN